MIATFPGLSSFFKNPIHRAGRAKIDPLVKQAMEHRGRRLVDVLLLVEYVEDPLPFLIRETSRTVGFVITGRPL